MRYWEQVKRQNTTGSLEREEAATAAAASADDEDGPMKYHFHPEMKPLVFPPLEIMTPGSDM
jgi:hypothetical protein